MRVLIVGAGIAGLTLHALLQQRGIESCVIDKAANSAHAGYVLGLWLLGSRVLHGLHLFDRYVEASAPMSHYHILNEYGCTLRELSFDSISDQYGYLGMISRADLLEILSENLSVRNGVTLQSATRYSSGIEAELSDGTRFDCDLLVGADGIHSKVRRDFFGPGRYWNTGWGCWVWWGPQNATPPATATEYWGNRLFLGLYSTPTRTGIFACAPLPDIQGDGKHAVSDRLLHHFRTVARVVPAAFEPLATAEPYFWKLEDVRSPEWVQARMVLLGDAAAAFLPTAGVGASMAMESAAALADELTRTDSQQMENALNVFVQRRMRRVHAIQTQSRRLSQFAFVKSPVLSAVRNRVLSFTTLKMFAGPIAKGMNSPI